MKKNLSWILLLLTPVLLSGQQEDRKRIDAVLTSWHQAAARADFDTYFGHMTEEAAFIGTDAGENWARDAFMTFSRPYFEAGKAWSFSAIERNIYLAPGGEFAWFDELLDTWMQICRGSGVLQKIEGDWKIAHYVLSMTMPNEEVEGAIALKKTRDSLTMRKLRTLTND